MILNFEPQGVEGVDGEPGHYRVGLRHPLYTIDDGLNNKGVDAKIVSADLYNEDIFTLIDKCMEIFSSQDGVPSFTKAHMNQE